jgi:hypothetical protein
MAYRLQNQVSFCQVAERTLFLDLRRDRYFCLGAAMEATFRQILKAEPIEEDARERLLALGVLRAADVETSISPTHSVQPTRSLADDRPAAAARIGTLATVISASFGARRQLNRRSLHDVVDRLSARKALAPHNADVAASLDQAARFGAARRKVPFKPACLADALALLDVLATRQCYPELVFGVRVAPFGAHCWVQSGSVVLNDPLDRVLAHTPILVV